MTSKIKIQPGDTLWKIAKEHDVTVDALKQANHLESDRIAAGGTLSLPDSYGKATQQSGAAAADARQTAVDVREARSKKKDPPGATAARYDKASGAVYAKIGGKEVKIGKSNSYGMGKLPKILGEGRYVAFANNEGGYGYENEGQALYLHDTKTGKTKKVMDEYFMIDDVSHHKLSDGREALVVKMSDGGLGAPHSAVVDPQRGEVWRSTRTSVAKVDKDHLHIGFHADDEHIEKVTSRKDYDLKALLNRSVIRNSPDFPAGGPTG